MRKSKFKSIISKTEIKTKKNLNKKKPARASPRQVVNVSDHIFICKAVILVLSSQDDVIQALQIQQLASLFDLTGKADVSFRGLNVSTRMVVKVMQSFT